MGDDSVRDVWRALPRVAQTEAAPAQPAESAVVQFTGYSEKQMHTIKEMSGQLRWNEALNILEAIVAAGVIAGGGFETGLGSTERLLYITCCLSNAFCLRCGPLRSSTTSTLALLDCPHHLCAPGSSHRLHEQ